MRNMCPGRSLDLENGGLILKHNSGGSHGAELVSIHIDMGDSAKLGTGIATASQCENMFREMISIE